MTDIAIVGAGFMGATHLGAYQRMDDVRVTAVVNRGEEKGRALAEKAGCGWYADIASMLSECGGETDVIDICLPTYLHRESTVEAAKAGKHVFCEKPAALSLEDYRQMVKTCEENGVTLSVGHVIRYWPEYAYAREMLKNGEFGALKYARATRMSCVSKRARDGGWFTRPERSGGGLLDLHIHDVDYLISIFGELSSVYAVGSQNTDGSWSYICSSLTFKSGLGAVAEGISQMPSGFPFAMELNIVGESRALCYRMGAGENLYDVNSASRITRVYSNSEEPRTVCTEHPDAYYLELRDFVDHVKSKTPLTAVTTADVEYTLKVMLAIRDSLESGKIIEIE